jgi:FeS assembly SUF system protein
MSDPVAALTLKPAIIDAICSVFDPEIPVNIWELGLIYDIDVDSENRVHIQMTLTAPACPSAQSLPLEVEHKVRAVPGVKDVYVEVVWEPAWTTDRMSDEAKLQLGMW